MKTCPSESTDYAYRPGLLIYKIEVEGPLNTLQTATNGPWPTLWTPMY